MLPTVYIFAPKVYTHGIYWGIYRGCIPWDTIIYRGCILWITCTMFPTVYNIPWGPGIYRGEHDVNVVHGISRYNIPWASIYIPWGMHISTSSGVSRFSHPFQDFMTSIQDFHVNSRFLIYKYLGTPGLVFGVIIRFDSHMYAGVYQINTK